MFGQVIDTIKDMMLLFLLLLFPILVEASCQGCCSRNGGVICSSGVTLCGNQTPLTPTCLSKGCNKCSAGHLTSTNKSTTQPAILLKKPPISQLERILPYNRKEWPMWIDADNDCQDTRSEILQRDNLGEIKWKRNKRCNVSWGRWICPYTGKAFTKASDLDIDHIVPLAHAHRTGGAKWTRTQKRIFANDFDNLISVEDKINKAKSDQTPLTWRPPKKEYWCTYAIKWEAVKKKYNLIIDTVEQSALAEMLKSCAKK